MGKISMMPTPVALSKPFQQKTKQQQKEIRNEDQLKPNLITFSGLLMCVWPVTDNVWSVTLVALVNTDNEPRKIARLNNQRFTCLCCALEILRWLSRGPNPLIACYSNYLCMYVIIVRLHETINYHFPEVSKQKRFHYIFMMLLKLLSLVLLKRKVHLSFGE